MAAPPLSFPISQMVLLSPRPGKASLQGGAQRNGNGNTTRATRAGQREAGNPVSNPDSVWTWASDLDSHALLSSSVKRKLHRVVVKIKLDYTFKALSTMLGTQHSVNDSCYYYCSEQGSVYPFDPFSHLGSPEDKGSELG